MNLNLTWQQLPTPIKECFTKPENIEKLKQTQPTQWINQLVFEAFLDKTIYTHKNILNHATPEALLLFSMNHLNEYFHKQKP